MSEGLSRSFGIADFNVSLTFQSGARMVAYRILMFWVLFALRRPVSGFQCQCNCHALTSGGGPYGSRWVAGFAEHAKVPEGPGRPRWDVGVSCPLLPGEDRIPQKNPPMLSFHQPAVVKS